MIHLDFSQAPVQAALVSFTGLLISILTTLYIARRNIQKDARARSRVEWIASVRTALSLLITSIDKSRRARINGLPVEINERSAELLGAQIQLLLLLNDEPAQIALTSQIKTCVNSVLQQGLGYDPTADLDGILLQTRQVISKEWGKAKNGQ